MSDSIAPKHVRLRRRPVTIRRRPSGNTINRMAVYLADLIIAIGIFAVAFSVNLDNVNESDFHPDESRWLNRAYFIDELSRPYGSTWQDYYITRGQPPLGSYVIGIGQLVQGTSLTPNLVWDFFYSTTNWNQIIGAVPNEDNLTSGRRTSAFVGALAVVCAYFVARRMTNQLGGIVAALLIAWHGLSIRIGSQALSDQTLLLTLGLAFLAAFQFVKRPTWPWAVVLGVCFGLGGSAKLTPLLLSLAAAGMGGLLLFRWLVVPLSDRERKRDRSMAIKLILQPLFAFVAFVASYPYLWVDPIRRTWNLYNFRITEMDSQGRAFPEANVEGIQDVFNRINNRGNLGGGLQSTWKIMQWINDRTGQSFEMIAELDLMIAALSVPFMILIAFRYGLRSPHFLVTILLGAEAALIIGGLRSDLYRYYLPLVMIMFICIGIMFGMIAEWIVKLSTRRRKPVKPALTRAGRAPSILNNRVARYRRPSVRPRTQHLVSRV